MIWPRWRQRRADGSLVSGATDPPSGGPDMRRSRCVAAALMLIVLASTAASLSSPAGAAARGKLVLAWHAGLASRWLDPQEHDGTATPDNFFTAIHDGLIKNQGTALFDHPALAEKFTVAPDAKSATFTLRKGIKFHNGEPVTPQDVKFSYENYRGAKADVFKKKTERVEIVDDRTIRFVFKEPFLDFAILFGTANVAGPGWVVPEKYYRQVGPDGFKQKPIGAGPYKLVRHEPGVKVEMEAFDGYYRPVHVKELVMTAVPEASTRVAMLERREADYPNGLDVDWVTPLPTFYSRGERLIAQLREVGIRGRLQTMERGIFFQRLQGGLKEFPGTQIILNGVRIAGSWSFWYEGYFKCGGFNSRDRICVKDLDGKFDQYERSINPAERKKLAEEIQRGILENYYLVPVFRHAFVNAIGPRIVAQKLQDVFPTITTGYAYPWEDLKVKE